jgi:hypothetical protein
MLGTSNEKLTVLKIIFVMCVPISFTYSSKKLVPWLRLIFRCHTLLELYYQSWSYVAKTGMATVVLLVIYLLKLCIQKVSLSRLFVFRNLMFRTVTPHFQL